ncbi:hypothetical protein MVEG_00501 [Podila verticillata NRRL 6337]|nr:hypothetical protein MVEG_00501 [Podila verticillata NRRL 6337]
MNHNTLILNSHLVGPSQEEYFHADLGDYQSDLNLHYYHSSYYPNVYPDGLANLRKGPSSYRHTDPLRNGTAQGGMTIESNPLISVEASEETKQYEWRRNDLAMPSSSLTSSLAYPLAPSSVTVPSHVNVDESSGVRSKALAQQQHFQHQQHQQHQHQHQQHQHQHYHQQQGSNMPLLLSSSLSSTTSLHLYSQPAQVAFHAGTVSSPPSVPTILDEHAVMGSSPVTPASSPTAAMDYVLSTANQGYMFVPSSSHPHFQADHSCELNYHQQHEQEQTSVSLHGNRTFPSYLPVSIPTGFQGYQQAETVAWANASVSNPASDMVQGHHHHHQYYSQQQQKLPRAIKSKPKHLRRRLHVMTSLDSGIASMYPTGATQLTKDFITTTSPNTTMAPGPGYTWGHTSSPVESNFSGSSTPSFASLSPSLSHSSNSEASASCESSRATSPSSLTVHESNLCAPNQPEGRKQLSETDSSIIRARKSSTSSTSSAGSTSKRRMSTLRESTVNDASSSTTSPITSTASSHQCPQCEQYFAGPAVLVRHIESIHDKLLWNCVGCKSNLSRRDAVTRHINLSPMDSICRAVGTIGQIKMMNGSEVHYEISTYRAKPLEEVMGRMSAKRASVSSPSADVQTKEFGCVKVEPQDEEEDIDADGMEEIEYGFVGGQEHDAVVEEGHVDRDERKKRRRSSVVSIGRKKKY